MVNMLKWLQNVMVGRRGPTQVDKTPFEMPSKLLDIAHEVLAKEASEKQQVLRGVERYGGSLIQRQQFRLRVQMKVRKFLSLTASEEDANDMMEEVTERITEAAEVDPYYKKMFDDSDEKK